VVSSGTYAHGSQKVLGLLVDIEHAGLAVLREVEGGHLWHVLVLALTLLFLKLEGDTADWATLDTLHQVGGVAGNLFRIHQQLSVALLFLLESVSCGFTHLVAQSLGRNDGDLIADTLVGLEVESQLWVVTLNDDLGGLLDGLGTNATHVCGCAACIGWFRWLSMVVVRSFAIRLAGKISLPTEGRSLTGKASAPRIFGVPCREPRSRLHNALCRIMSSMPELYNWCIV